MASESRDRTSLTVSLPPELQQWLDRQATALEVDQETVLLRLLSAYRDANDLDEPLSADPSRETIEPVVRDVLTDRLPDLTDAVAEQIAADLREELAADLDGEDEALRERIDDLEADYRDKLEDVRQRVVQVKRDADANASVEELTQVTDRLSAVEDTVERLEGVTDRLDAVESELSAIDDHDDRLAELSTELDGVESQLSRLGADDEVDVTELAEQLSDTQEKLKTVAWVVRDLREAVAGGGAAAATVEQIKHQAASEDVSRASCENCGNGVEIALLTEPSCPHCDATIDGVEPSKRRFGFGSATLTVAAGLEPASDGRDELDDISTARRGDRG